jgi:hypothetical protein
VLDAREHRIVGAPRALQDHPMHPAAQLLRIRAWSTASTRVVEVLDIKVSWQLGQLIAGLLTPPKS